MIDVCLPNVKCSIFKCPICGEELVLIDNLNYFTSICPDCHTTVFEEYDGKLHYIKNGIMEDGYDASLDIFMKTLLAYSMDTFDMDEDEKHHYFAERLYEGEFLNFGIYQKDIFEYYNNVFETKEFNLKSPCIYFDGYEKYLNYMSEFQDEIDERRNDMLEALL